MDSGFIKLHRALLESKVWTMPPSHRAVAITCLLLANWKHGEMMSGGEVIQVPPGSFVTSRGNLSARCGVSINQVRLALARLKDAEVLTLNGTNRWTQIWITNWHLYQLADEQGHQPSTSQAPANHQQTTTIEEGKKGRREEDPSGGEGGDVLAGGLFGDANPPGVKGPTDSDVKRITLRALEHLNGRTGRQGSNRFRAGKVTQGLIKAILKARHAEADIIAVIDAKARQWGSDRERSHYLRPDTLFRLSNFERYLEIDTAGTVSPVAAQPARKLKVLG